TRSERNAARLVLALARQAQRRNGISPGENGDALGTPNSVHAAAQAERIGPCDRHMRQAQDAAALRQELVMQRNFPLGQNGRQLQVVQLDPKVPQQQPPPAIITERPVDNISPPFTRLGRVEVLREGWTGIPEAFEKRETAL